MKQKRFPSEVILKWNQAFDNQPFLETYEEIESAAEIDKSVKVGIYRLAETRTVVTEVKTTVR